MQKATGTSCPPFSTFFPLPPPFHSQTRLREKMSGMQQRIKRREGPLHPTHTCWASTPNLSESISSPPLVQSNYITLVSNQSVSLHHSSHIHPSPLFCFLLLCSPPSPLSVESRDFKKGNGFGQNVLGHSSAVGRQRIIPICL